jgi:anti-sigma factor RsiW
VSQQNAKVGIGIAAIEWRAADFAFVLIGPLSVDEMQSVAESAAARVNLPAPGQ